MMSGNQDKEKLPPLIAFDATEAIKAHFSELDYPVVILTTRDSIPDSEKCLASLADRINKIIPGEFKIKIEQPDGSKEAEQTDSSEPKKRKKQQKTFKPVHCCVFANKMPGKKSFMLMPASVFNYLTTNNNRSDKSIYDKNIYKLTNDYLDLTINALANENKSKLKCLLNQMHTYINSLPNLRKEAVEFTVNAQVLEEKYENSNSASHPNTNTTNVKWDNLVAYNVTNFITDETFTIDGKVVNLDKKVPVTMISFPNDAAATKKQASLRKQASQRKYLEKINYDLVKSPFSKPYHNLIFILSEIFDHSSMRVMTEEDFLKKQKKSELTTPKEFSLEEKIKFQTYFDEANKGKGKKTPGNLIRELIINRKQFDAFFSEKLLNSNEPFKTITLTNNEKPLTPCFVDATIIKPDQQASVIQSPLPVQNTDQGIQSPIVDMELDTQSQQPITAPTLLTHSSTQFRPSMELDFQPQQPQSSSYLSFPQLMELYNKQPPLAYSNNDSITPFPFLPYQSVQNKLTFTKFGLNTTASLPNWITYTKTKRKELTVPERSSLDLLKSKKQKTFQEQPSIFATVPPGTLFENTEIVSSPEQKEQKQPFLLATVPPGTLFMEDTEMFPIQEQKENELNDINLQKTSQEQLSITKDTILSKDVDIHYDPYDSDDLYDLYDPNDLEISQTQDATMLIGYEDSLNFLNEKLNDEKLLLEIRQEIKKLLERISEANKTDTIEKVNYLHKRFRKLKVNVSIALKKEADDAEKEKTKQKKASAQDENQSKLKSYNTFVNQFSSIFGKYYNNVRALPKLLSKQEKIQDKNKNVRNDEKLFQPEVLANKANFIYQAPVSRLTNLLDLKVIIPEPGSKTIIPKEIFKNILSGPIKSFELPTIANFEHNPKIKKGIREFKAGNYQKAFDNFHSAWSLFNENSTSKTVYTDAFYSALYIEEMCELLCSNVRKLRQPKNVKPCDPNRTMLIQEFSIDITIQYNPKTKQSTESMQTIAKSPAEINYARDHLIAYTKQEIAKDIPVAKEWMKDKTLKPVILKNFTTPISFLHKASQTLPNQFGRHQLFMNAFIFTNYPEIGAQLKSYFGTVLACWENTKAEIQAKEEKAKNDAKAKKEKNAENVSSHITNPNRLFQPEKEVTPRDFSDVRDQFTSPNTDFARNMLERSIEKPASNDKTSDNVSIPSRRKTAKTRS